MTNTNILTENITSPEQFNIPTERLERLQGELTERVNDPAFDDLARIFGAELPSGDIGTRLASLTELANA